MEGTLYLTLAFGLRFEGHGSTVIRVGSLFRVENGVLQPLWW